MTSKPKHNPFGAPLDVRGMLTTSPPKLVHVLPGLLEGTAALLAASGGTGKTTLLVQMAFAVASAGPLCDGLFDDVHPDFARSRIPGKVVMVAAEESSEVLWHRMHAVFQQLVHADVSLFDKPTAKELLELLHANVHIHALAGKSRALLVDEAGDPTDALDQLIEASKGAKLVLLDPIRQFHRGDENDSWAMTALVQATQLLAAKTRASVLLAHHTNRASTTQGTGDTAGAARGSTALTDGVRWQMNMSRLSPELAKAYDVAPGDEGRYLRVDIAKANYLPPQPPQVLQRGTGGALSLVRTKRPGAKPVYVAAGATQRAKRPPGQDA
jgi:regulatory protein RepA